MTTTDPERWRPVPGYEHAYSVSDRGRVRSEARVIHRTTGHRNKQTVHQRILAAGPDCRGQRRVSLCRGPGCRPRTLMVDTLVAAAFGTSS